MRGAEERKCKGCENIFIVGGAGNPRKTQVYCSLECRSKMQPPPSQRGRVHSAPAKTLSVQDAAYIAGILDGEGSIVKVYNKNRTNYSVRVAIVNTYRPVIDWLLETTGCGTIVTKLSRKPGIHKDCYIWQCYSENAKNILRQILPYLIIKEDKAREAIEQEYV